MHYSGGFRKQRGLMVNAMISVVDDDAFVREPTADFINSLGYAVRTFHSAEEFLASGHLQKTKCLITDLQMPGLDGLQLQDRVLSQGYRIPIIFITAFPKESARTRAVNAGAIGFLAKPFDDSRLERFIELALSPRRGPMLRNVIS
jgi:FixJ family two-component response regulator